MCQAMWGADGRHSHYCDSLHWKTKLEEGCERLYRDLRHNRHRGLHLPSRLAAVTQAFPQCTFTPCVLGQHVGLPNLGVFLFGDLTPHPKKADDVRCYSLKVSRHNLMCNCPGFALPPLSACSSPSRSMGILLAGCCCSLVLLLSYC